MDYPLLETFELRKDSELLFGNLLMAWYRPEKRPTPWKGEKNPYKIWLSEVILQQTRVEQGWAYYERFVETFPTVQALAAAPADAVMKLWEGLGYYSRARNLHAAAKQVVEMHNGLFPNTYEGLLSLKGVGAYSAAAIASFAFDLPHAVLDGNVFRVLARFFGIHLPIDMPKSKGLFAQTANNCLANHLSAIYNQAIMDFGATICTPQNPLCTQCPLASDCVAFKRNWVNILPIKEKKKITTTRYFYYFDFVLDDKKHVICKRVNSDIWRDLYEFPMVELPQNQDQKAVIRSPYFAHFVENAQYRILQISNIYKQQLTHQTIFATFIKIELHPQENWSPKPNWLLVNQEEIRQFAFPKMFDAYSKDNTLNLNFL